MELSRISFANPTSSDIVLNISGDAFIIESSPEETDHANYTTIQPGDGQNDLAGIPTINRTKVVFSDKFQKLTVKANAGATAGTSYIITFHTRSIDLELPPA